MKLLHETTNDLLQRREVKVALQHAGNPGYGAAQKKVAEVCGTSEEMVVIKSVRNPYGVSEFLIEAFVYDSADAKQKFEPKPKAKKGA